jgi:hypothetical protein
MPDRYIERKGIIFDEIAEKGDVDQTTRLRKENRNLLEKMETLEREYGKVRKVLEFVMPLIENMDEDFRRQFFEKRKEQLLVEICIKKADPFLTALLLFDNKLHYKFSLTPLPE